MLEIPIKKPRPDFELLTGVLQGSAAGYGIMNAELLIDEEVKKFIVENYFNEKNVPPPAAQRFGSADGPGHESDKFKTASRNYHLHLIDFYYRMGYHFIPDLEFYLDF